jgi:hypothetical protein
MKKTIEEISTPTKENGKSKLKGFLERQTDRLKNGHFTCPFCREVFSGISSLGSHLKDHCT